MNPDPGPHRTTQRFQVLVAAELHRLQRETERLRAQKETLHTRIQIVEKLLPGRTVQLMAREPRFRNHLQIIASKSARTKRSGKEKAPAVGDSKCADLRGSAFGLGLLTFPSKH